MALETLMGEEFVGSENGGALEDRRNGRAGKRLSKHPKMDKNKLSTKTPQLDFPRKIHTHWIKTTCDSRFCVLDVSEQKTHSLELRDGLPRHGPSASTKDLCFSFVILIRNETHTHTHTDTDTQTHTHTHTHSHEDKDGLLETQQNDLRQRCGAGIRHFLGQSFRTRSVLSKTCQWTLQKAEMDSPFCTWSESVLWKNHVFGESVWENRLSN